MINRLPIETWLELNAKLQQKKNYLRSMLNEKGVMKKDKENGYDHYSYFSEAGYKKLFTELFPKAFLDLSYTEMTYETYQGSEKQPNGRLVHLMFTLSDTQTGFYEQTEITSEALDKGDKAGYKAYTGALKYYLANTFMVATGDDPETESPEAQNAGFKKQTNVKARQQSNTQSKATTPAPQQTAGTGHQMSPETKEIFEAFDKKVKDWMLGEYNRQNYDEITEDDVQQVLAMMKMKEAQKNGK